MEIGAGMEVWVEVEMEFWSGRWTDGRRGDGRRYRQMEGWRERWREI